MWVGIFIYLWNGLFDMKKKKDFITKKIKIPKGYKASELVSDDDSGVIVFDKEKKGKK